MSLSSLSTRTNWLLGELKAITKLLVPQVPVGSTTANLSRSSEQSALLFRAYYGGRPDVETHGHQLKVLECKVASGDVIK
jgi:hypothetical protein